MGPAPHGEEIDCGGDIKIAESEAGWGPFIQKGSRDEIIIRENPRARYGVGVLYPVDELVGATRDAAKDLLQIASVHRDASGWTSGAEDGPLSSGEVGYEQAEDGNADEEVLREDAAKSLRKIRTRVGGPADPDTVDLSAANTYRPSVMGLTFLAEVPEGSKLIVEAPVTSQSPSRTGSRTVRVNGRYVKKKVEIAGKERVWWLRQAVLIRTEFDANALRSPSATKLTQDPVEARGTEGLDLCFEVYTRPHIQSGTWLITVCLVNRTKHSGDEACLFQTHFRAWIESPTGSPHICPYPNAARVEDPEEQSLALLYRGALTFAAGHGCSADWDAEAGATRACQVRAECLPLFEAPSITPEVFREIGTGEGDDERQRVEVPMAPLAGLVAGIDGMASVREVVDLYETWLGRQRNRVRTEFEEELRTTAAEHLSQCEDCLKRMKDGLNFLAENKVAQRSFQLANHAILIQQARSRVETRRLRYDLDDDRVKFSAEHPNPPMTGTWRPFQIAFLLMSLRSAMDGEAPDREMVELIWFPTGGGKTEAYLGLAAFSMFARRFAARRNAGTNDAGTHVLMRYTLRLLTTQQFQRASALLCAMEHLRRECPTELGDEEFSIGIWVGGENTPNRAQDAVKALRDLRAAAKRSRAGVPPENPFVLTRCPWCAAQMGPIDSDGIISGKSKRPMAGPSRVRGRRDDRSDDIPRVYGYVERQGTVVFKCPDQACMFKKGLPVCVIDEDIYERRPTLVIGTVDKFAMLTWRPTARGLFGISADGERDASPPGLIIQDELHLISGPLGSMVGLYETLIEELCTDRRDGRTIRPKIVSSTATIRRYREQIQALYGRDQVTLFPPPGIDAGDSFFATYARDKQGRLLPGRIYIGVHGTGTGSLQTDQVRTFTSLLQAPFPFTDEERDPWWTLLVFFNSLRVLGSGVSLFQSDIPEHFRSIRNREGLDWNQTRWLENIKELTGRLRNTEVPLALEELSTSCGQRRQPVDVCLASNIIEVGVDIDRLSLMSVVGQPKTTSQYIQVTGRVGRKWAERPGLVVTIYIVSQPRDRSLYEKFRSYHEKLYAQVEPTSVTPFSPPALDRALHAVLSGYVRQTGNPDVSNSPWPIPTDFIDRLRSVLYERIRRVSKTPRQLDEDTRLVDAVLMKRVTEWTNWQPRHWDGSGTGADTPLLRLAGAYASEERRLFSWPTPMSMRSVDAECHADITQLYKLERLNSASDQDGKPDTAVEATAEDEDDA